MKLVGAGQKGTSVKLNPMYENKIFVDKTDDDEDVVIVKGRVVRVDQASPKMGRALMEPMQHPNLPNNIGGPLLVETSEAPTPIAQPLNERLTALDTEARKNLIREEGARLGLTVSETSVDEGETTDLTNKKRLTGQAVVPNADASANAGDTSPDVSGSKKSS